MTTPQKPIVNPTPEDLAALAKMRTMSRRSFAVGAIAALTGLGAWKWLTSRSTAEGIPWPFRKTHEFNEAIGRGLYSPSHLAPEFDVKYAGEPRVNGGHGIPAEVIPAEDWRLIIERPDAAEKSITLAELTKLPRVDSVHELKCVEGWSQIVHWGGYRFADFLREFDLLPPAGSPLQFLELTTPNQKYTVALDLPSAMHPQAILCDSMNGAPLTEGHGAPIRLVLPVKYGIKNIKWLSRIRFQATKPTDYWTERGYDWYAGL